MSFYAVRGRIGEQHRRDWVQVLDDGCGHCVPCRTYSDDACERWLDQERRREQRRAEAEAAKAQEPA